MATAAAVASVLVSAASVSEQRQARKGARSAREATERRLQEAEANRVRALQESEFAVRERRKERRGGFNTTIAGASLLGGNNIGNSTLLGG
jgi:hypothetical protein